MIALVLALLILIVASPASAAEPLRALAAQPLSPALSALLAEVETYPEDYGALVRLARAASQAGERDLELAAWQQAGELSGGSLEISLARSLTLLAMGHHRDARRAARQATDQSPGSVLAWSRLAWILRHRDAPAPASYDLLTAERAYLRALALDPADPIAQCGIAWTRLALGDRLGAGRGFRLLRLRDEAASSQCGDGLGQNGHTLRLGFDVSFSGIAHDGNPSREGGLSLLLRGGLTLDDFFFAQIAGRLLAYDPKSDDPFDQQEIWGRIGVRHRDFGAQLLIAGLRNSLDEQGRLLIGAQGWAGYGVTLRGEGAFGRYPDGRVSMGGVALRAPVMSFLQLEAGLRISSFRPVLPADLRNPPGAPADLPPPAERINLPLDGPYPSARLRALVDVGPVHLGFTGRFGDEIRPIDFDQPSVWNTREHVSAGFDFEGALALGKGMGISAGYSVNRLQDLTGGDAFHSHVFTIGFFAEMERGWK